jgi:hypothetical protein
MEFLPSELIRNSHDRLVQRRFIILLNLDALRALDTALQGIPRHLNHLSTSSADSTKTTGTCFCFA